MGQKESNEMIIPPTVIRGAVSIYIPMIDTKMVSGPWDGLASGGSTADDRARERNSEE